MTHFESLAQQIGTINQAHNVNSSILEKAIHKAHSAREITYPQYQHLITLLDGK